MFISRVYHGRSSHYTLRACREAVSQQGGSIPRLATSRIQIRMYAPRGNCPNRDLSTLLSSRSRVTNSRLRAGLSLLPNLPKVSQCSLDLIAKVRTPSGPQSTVLAEITLSGVRKVDRILVESSTIEPSLLPLLATRGSKVMRYWVIREFLRYQYIDSTVSAFYCPAHRASTQAVQESNH